MYHEDIKLTSGAVILAALLLSVTDSKAAIISKPVDNVLDVQLACSQPEKHTLLLTSEPG
jgi:hypothetical protein